MGDDLFADITQFLKDSPELADPYEGKIIDEETLSTIILNFLEGRGEQGATEDEVVQVVMYVQKIILSYAMIQLFLKGVAYMDDPSGKWEGDDVQIRLKVVPNS